jgi:hypothetical protein
VPGKQAVVVATEGKQVPLTPKWLYKSILSTNFGPFEAQLIGDYVGRRYVTYLNDLSVRGTFLMGLEASYIFDRPLGNSLLQDIKLSANTAIRPATRKGSIAEIRRYMCES